MELLANAALLVALAVTLYALGQKLVPGFHVPGVFNLDRTEIVPRLQEPFGYWNALGLFIAFGVPIGLAVTTDVGRSFRVRLTALASVELMLLGVGLTYSRGALLALVCGLAVGVGLSGARLRLLTWLALAALATVPQQPEPAAVRRLSEPIGVVEGGGRGVQRQTDLGLGSGLIPGPPPALPPQLSLRSAAAQRAAANAGRDGNRRHVASAWRLWAADGRRCQDRTSPDRHPAAARRRLSRHGLESKILSGWAELLLTPPSGSATSRPSPAPAG